VPDRAGEVLAAKVTVTSNGNQRFVVPVSLAVGGSFVFDAPAALPAAPKAPAREAGAPAEAKAAPGPAAFPRRLTPAGWAHAAPALLLAGALLAVMLFDLVGPRRVAVQAGGQLPSGQADEGGYVDLRDTEPRLMPEFNDSVRFGLLMHKERDPENPSKHKRLTYQEKGGSNNTCVRLEGQEHLFGLAPGRFVRGLKNFKARERHRWTSSVDYPEGVRVTQVVEIVPNQQTRYLDTCLVRYAVENRSNSPRKVGLRVLLDTFIGANDGVPFRVPGAAEFLQTMQVFPEKEVPDYVQAWERADLTNPGTIAHLGLKGFDIPDVTLEPIVKLVICRWPSSEERWAWEYAPMNEPPDERGDSCVVLYWAERAMNPKEVRHMAFTYGLNTISSVESGNADLSLTAGGAFKPGGVFTLTATVTNPRPGQKVRVHLPAGLALVPGEPAELDLDHRGAQTQATWRVRAEKVGRFDISVTTGAIEEGYRVTITTRSIFD
jgi:hypothetical protein